jgi:outer membrane biosynthesis protein TonB
MGKLHLLMICGFIATPTALQSQVKMSQEELAAHLMSWVAPIYPAEAQNAHVQGNVVSEVELSPDGLVRSTKIISGPPI